MECIQYPGIGEIKLRRGSHIRHFSIRMAPGKGVWVNVPYGVSGAQVRKFIADKKEWILETRNKIKKIEKKTGTEVVVGGEIKTRLHVLKIEETQEPAPFYLIKNTQVTVFIPRGTDSGNVKRMIGNFLLVIYRKECQMILPERIDRLAREHGFSFNRVAFRNNSSNWGSCSYDNKISLNIKLMKLPDELIDYVILHELCHTVEKNHSADFWEQMARVCPGYKENRRKLRTYNTRV